jgi:SAM-dependent methyltransferase
LIDGLILLHGATGVTTLADYWRIWRARGFRRLYDELAENLLFDLVHGTDTQTVAKPDPAHLRAGANPYVPSYAGVVTLALDRLPPAAPRATFYDLGCGKGKVLLLAARSGRFDRIVGIELDAVLADVARANAHKIGMDERISVVTGDASVYRGYSEEIVLYAYNPFEAEAFAKVLANLEGGAVRHATLIYFDPQHESLLAGWVARHRLPWPGDPNRTLAIYERRFERP